MKMCWFCLDQNMMANAVQCNGCMRNCSLFFVIHKQRIQLAHSELDCERKWEFYDLFELCGPFTTREGIGFRLTMTSQWLEHKLSTFSALDSSQISEPSGPTTNICQMEKEQWIVVVLCNWMWRNIELFLPSLPGILKPSHWTSP